MQPQAISRITIRFMQCCLKQSIRWESTLSTKLRKERSSGTMEWPLVLISTPAPTPTFPFCRQEQFHQSSREEDGSIYGMVCRANGKWSVGSTKGRWVVNSSSVERAAEDFGQKCSINILGLTAHIIMLISEKGEQSLNEQERVKAGEE